MPIEYKTIDGEKCVELIPDFLGESRHEFVARLAYQNWERGACPLAHLRLTGLPRKSLIRVSGSVWVGFAIRE